MNATNRPKAKRTSDEAVRRATGRGQDEWFALLDAWGAAAHQHCDIAAWIMQEHDVDNWWAQTLTVNYELARRLREPRGTRKGTFAITASTTIGVTVKQVYDAFIDPAVREHWLPGARVRGRTSQPGRSARFDWEAGDTRVNVGFTAKGTGTSQVALRHERLPNAKAAEEMRAYWRERLKALTALMKR
jgi:uncharacterized protein YndB with AHSA1/START domain